MLQLSLIRCLLMLTCSSFLWVIHIPRPSVAQPIAWRIKSIKILYRFTVFQYKRCGCYNVYCAQFWKISRMEPLFRQPSFWIKPTGWEPEGGLLTEVTVCGWCTVHVYYSKFNHEACLHIESKMYLHSI